MKGKGKILRTICKLFDDHGPTILTIGSVIFEGIALMSAYKASEDIAYSKTIYETEKLEAEKQYENHPDKTRKMAIRTIMVNRMVRDIYAYRWAILCSCASAGMSIGANKISGAKIAGLTAALALSEDKLKKLTAKVKETLGDEKFDEFKEDFAMENIREFTKSDEFQPPFDEDLELFYDPEQDSLFEAKKSQVENAIAIAEGYCSRNHVLPFNKWRGFLGLQDLMAAGCLEWNALNPFSVKLEPHSGAYRGKDVWFLEYGCKPTVHKLAPQRS